MKSTSSQHTLFGRHILPSDETLCLIIVCFQKPLNAFHESAVVFTVSSSVDDTTTKNILLSPGKMPFSWKNSDCSAIALCSLSYDEE